MKKTIFFILFFQLGISVHAQTSGNGGYFGSGLSIGKGGFIAEIEPVSSAINAGMEACNFGVWYITSIQGQNGYSIKKVKKKMSSEEVEKALVGKAGSTVTISVKEPKQKITKTYTLTFGYIECSNRTTARERIIIETYFSGNQAPAVQDRDGDLVSDCADQCPDVKGSPDYLGCAPTDTDNDGVHDKIDECPTVKGEAEYHGCPPPDADKDGVPDKDDQCKDVAGPASNKGCPVVTVQPKPAPPVNTISVCSFFENAILGFKNQWQDMREKESSADEDGFYYDILSVPDDISYAWVKQPFDEEAPPLLEIVVGSGLKSAEAKRTYDAFLAKLTACISAKWTYDFSTETKKNGFKSTDIYLTKITGTNGSGLDNIAIWFWVANNTTDTYDVILQIMPE